MGNITNNNKKKAGIVILILWIVTVGMLLFRFSIELESYAREIEYATPEYVELTEEELAELEERREIQESIMSEMPPLGEGNQDLNTPSQTKNDNPLEENRQYLAKLKTERNWVIVKIILVIAYLVLGIVAFVRLRNKEKTRAVLFASLAVINVLVLFMLPEMFMASSGYSKVYITNA